MSFTNSADINIPSGQSILGFESPDISSGTSFSYDSHGEDLSLSDLSLTGESPVMGKPFSLLPRREPDPDMHMPRRNGKHESIGGIEVQEGNDEVLNEAEEGENRKHAAKLKEEKLQSDIFILKKLNASFEVFNEALEDTGSANERVAAQLEQTDALLNKYINILSTSEDYARLIFDDRWLGAEEDERVLDEIRIKDQERRQREKEETALRALQEAARLEKERQERIKIEEKERLEREKSERAMRGGVRGVRGTRASMRGGTTRASEAVSRKDPPAVTRVIKRPGSAAAARPSGITRPSTSRPP